MSREVLQTQAKRMRFIIRQGILLCSSFEIILTGATNLFQLRRSVSRLVLAYVEYLIRFACVWSTSRDIPYYLILVQRLPSLAPRSGRCVGVRCCLYV